jgi:hypothetical protein
MDSLEAIPNRDLLEGLMELLRGDVHVPAKAV